MRAVRLNKIDRVTGKVIGVRWRFEVYNADKQRNEPVPVDQIPKRIRESQDSGEVAEYCKSQAAIHDSIKHRAEKLRLWREEYHDFNAYLEKFKIFQQENAPNSYENDLFYLESYAFGFFLSHSSLNNINLWHHSFDDFRAWLKKVRPLKQDKAGLKINTQLKVINSLNRFLYFMFSKGLLEQRRVCPGYRRDEATIVSADDILKESEIPKLRQALKEIRPISEKMFVVLLYSGLRENECFGLNIESLFPGKFEGPRLSKIHSSLEKYGLGDYHGYICLDSQPALKCIRTSSRWTDRYGHTWPVNSVPRKSLKHRRQIEPKSYRYIPIYEKDAWNFLVEQTDLANDQHDKKVFGDNPKDYLLFDGLTASMFYSDLTKALQILKLRHRSPHKLRHTFLTWFYDKTNEDMFLAERVAGHRDRRDVERYGHLNELIGNEQMAKLRKKGILKRV